MKTVTRKQMDKLENLFYWATELSMEYRTANPELEYIAKCARNVGYVTAECHAAGIGGSLIFLVQNASTIRENFGMKFEEIARKSDVYVEGKEPQHVPTIAKRAAMYTMVAEIGDKAILRRNPDGIYILAYGFRKQDYTWRSGKYYGSHLSDLERCVKDADPEDNLTADVRLMHQVMAAMNYEPAYEEWIAFMPDCPSDEEIYDIAHDDYLEAMVTFCDILERYADTGLCRADEETWEFARKFVPSIRNY